MPRLRFNIRGKILTALLLLAIMTFGITRIITYYKIRQVGGYLRDATEEIFATSVQSTKEALNIQAQKDLLSLAEDQAVITNLRFERIAAEVDTLALYCENLLRNPPDKEHIPPGAGSSYPRHPQGGGGDSERIHFLRMKEILRIVHSNNPQLQRIFLGTKDGTFLMYPQGRVPPSYDPRKRPWYENAVKSHKTTWSTPYIEPVHSELVVSCSRAIFDDPKVPAAVVGATVTVRSVSEDFISTQVKRSGHAFLLDEKGNVIVRQGLWSHNLRWYESFKTENLLEDPESCFRALAKAMITGKKGMSKCEFEKTEYHLAYSPIPVTHWSIGIAMSEKDIIGPALNTEKKLISDAEKKSKHVYEFLRINQRIYFVIYLTALVAIIAVGIWLSKRMTRPIRELDNEVKKVGAGNLHHRILINTGDEIEDLADTFNKLTDALNVYIQDLKEATDARQKMEHELKIAHDIQMGFVPKAFPSIPDGRGVDLFAVLDPAKQVGGDMYDFFFIDDRRLCFAIGDVSGKGVPASLLMAITLTLVRAKTTMKPANQIMGSINRELCKDSENIMFVTLFLGILDLETGQLDFCNAGHIRPFILRNQRTVERLEHVHGIPLGIFEDVCYEPEKIILNPEDTVVLITDGITEAMDQGNNFYKDRRLKDLLSNLQGRSPKDISLKVLRDVADFSIGAEQSDDITILVLSYFGKHAEAEHNRFVPMS